MIYAGCYNMRPFLPMTIRAASGALRRRPQTQAALRAGVVLAVSTNGSSRKLRAEILMYYADAIEIILRTRRLREPGAAPIRESSSSHKLLWGRFDEAISRVGRVVRPLFQRNARALCRVGDPKLLSGAVGRADNFVVTNVGGWASLIRLIAYEIRSGAPTATRANAVAELADWHLLIVPADRRRFGGTGRDGAPILRTAYASSSSKATMRARRQRSFSRRNCLSPSRRSHRTRSFRTAAESSRYIDVAFAVTKYGSGERIEILDTSKDATREEKRDLILLIEKHELPARESSTAS